MSDNETTEVIEFEKGSWQDSLHKSATLLDRSTKARKQASALLWTGAQIGVEEWLPTATTDVSAEGLYNEVLTALGTARKGDASKIKTVALAVRNHGLVLAAHPNLSKAYAEARRLTQTVQEQEAEDDAAEKAIESIEVPKSTTTVEGAAAILLGKGIDGAVVAILDVLGKNNEAAHRAFMRAVSTEVAARVQAAKPKPAPKAGPKAGATQATPGAGTKATKATVADGKTKAKPAPKSASKGDPNAKALPPKATTKAKPAATVEHAEAESVESPEKGEPVAEPVHVGDDVPSHDAVDTPVVPVKKAGVKRAVPVRRPATRTA